MSATDGDGFGKAPAPVLPIVAYSPFGGANEIGSAASLLMNREFGATATCLAGLRRSLVSLRRFLGTLRMRAMPLPHTRVDSVSTNREPVDPFDNGSRNVAPYVRVF